MRRLCSLIIAAVCSAFLCHGQGVDDSAAFGDGERLTFVVSYRAALVPNINAGEVVFRTSSTTLDGIPVYNIYANAKVFSDFKWFYDLDDTYQTWLDRTTLKPLKYSFRLKGNKYRAVCDYTYDWDNNEVTTFFHNLGKPEGVTKVMPLSDRSSDAIALFYRLRSQDLSHLAIGRGNDLEMILDDTVRRITYKFLGREERSVKKLGAFKTLKFSCTIATSSGESFEDGSEFFLWVTDDANKMPIYLESPIKVGSVRVTLTKYQGLKYPLTAKL